MRPQDSPTVKPDCRPRADAPSVLGRAAGRARRLLIGLLAGGAVIHASEPPFLAISVYATAGDVLAHLAPPGPRDAILARLHALNVSRVFLEGRRGDECVPPATLREVRDWLGSRGIRTAGGIATVPGAAFGARQNEGLTWLNWEDPKTRCDVSGFFAETAPVFDEVIVDDFFCTGDTSPVSDAARAGRSWSEYRRDLLVELIDPLIVRPARASHPDVRLIIKFPQWYDRFHLFGYDPERMAPAFDQVWVGTEVRNPRTRRMGFVQPTEGYVNFRWLRSLCGNRTTGAWFDHIECTPENFVDQAFQSVLAGATELTLFHLGDLAADHPGDALLAQRLPDLLGLAARINGSARSGVAFYKPPNSDAEDNLYLADYLGMMGWPLLPEARWPAQARIIFLGAQAADKHIGDRLGAHLAGRGTAVVTPAFLRRVGEPAQRLAGVSVGSRCEPGQLPTVRIGKVAVGLDRPLDVDLAVSATSARVRVEAGPATRTIPVLTERRAGGGRVFVLNARTFSEDDFRAASEWLLSPRALGWSDLPTALADELRRRVLVPLGLKLSAPGGVGVYPFAAGACLYNFRDAPVEVAWRGRRMAIPAHNFRWINPR